MNDIYFEFNDEVIGFELEQYNQLHIVNSEKFLKCMIRLKQLEGEKFDDYFQEKYKGNSYLFNQKMTSKNTLVLDLNDFSKVINHLSFHKTSLLRKIYLSELTKNVDELKVYDIISDLVNEFEFRSDIELWDKDIGLTKIFETMFQGKISSELSYLQNTGVITDLLLEYIDVAELKRAIIIVDSSLKFFDLSPLITDERIIIFDTCINFNENSNNYIIFDDEINNIFIQSLLEKIEFHWPVEVNVDELQSLLHVYLHMILNDEVIYLSRPSDNLMVLYIIVRKLLNLHITIPDEIRESNKILKKYIDDYVV